MTLSVISPAVIFKPTYFPLSICERSPTLYFTFALGPPTHAGRRLCLGEPLARVELFIYLTSILQNLTLRPMVEPEDIDLTPLSSGLGNLPRPFQLCVQVR